MRLTHPGVAFLDRDGTLNAKADEGEYVTSPDEVVLLPGAAEAVRMLNDAGVRVAVVTNQRGIARGRMTQEDLAAVHARLSSLLEAAAGARIDRYEHCPHERDVCDCRKPGTGMMERVKGAWPWVDLARSAIVGDAPSDVEAGRRLGMTTVLLDARTPTLHDAVRRLLA